ncbi:hypothetical protein DKE48_003060 [Acinetobacter nosocomialis]|nr:hypothetical protein DKE48_003060 [Acinetobacter nosocomialis]
MEKSDFDGVLVLIIYREQLAEFVTAFSHIKNLKLTLKFQRLVSLNQSQNILGFINLNFLKIF